MNDLPNTRSWDRPANATFEEWMKTRIARASERRYDWNALKFQADFDSKYRRAQSASIGTLAVPELHKM